MSKGLLLVGAGGHARSCIDVIESTGQKILGLIDSDSALLGKDVLGYPVLGSDGEMTKLAKDCTGGLVTVGQIGRPKIRVELYNAIKNAGIAQPWIIAASAHVSRHANIGNGSIVMHHAFVNAGARVGVNCIVNTGAMIEHDVEIGDHCHIAIGAVLGGDVRIGANSFLGAGSIVSHGISIGPNSVIGAGCVVMSDCPAETLMRRAA